MCYSRTRRSAVVAAILAVALTGCAANLANHDLTSHQPYNAADVAFARQMITHHRQAISTAALARTRTKNPAVQRIADGIRRERWVTIEALTQLLEAWGEPAPQGASVAAPGDEGTPQLTTGPGLGGDEARRLRASSGAGFDRLLLSLLIEHHGDAVAMSRLEREVGDSPGARAIAKEIETGHAAEVTAMQKVLSLMPAASPR